MKQLAFLIGLWFVSWAATCEEFMLGTKDAPIALIEYGSLTCDSCIYFHREVMPKIQKHYIDTGKVNFIYRHFPTGEAAMQGAIAAQCAGRKYYLMLDKLYETVEDWYDADNQNNLFIMHANSLGIDPAIFELCLSNVQQKDAVLNQQQQASTLYDVRGTPTFIINNTVVRGKKSFSQIEALFNGLL